MIMYLYHFLWFILPGLPDFFHQKHFNMCTVKSCRFIEKESAASRCTFASTRHPHGTCHIRGWGCPDPPFQCCTLGVKTPQQEFSRGPFCFTVAIDLILNLHLLLLLGWGSHKEIILIYLITFCLFCVFRGVECDRSLGKLSRPHLLAWVLSEVPDLGHSFPKWCQVKYKLFAFISTTISIYFYLFSRFLLWFSWTIASCICHVYLYIYIYPPSHTDIPIYILNQTQHPRGKLPRHEMAWNVSKMSARWGEVSPPKKPHGLIQARWGGTVRDLVGLFGIPHCLHGGLKIFIYSGHEKNQHFGLKKQGFLKTSGFLYSWVILGHLFLTINHKFWAHRRSW